MEVSFRLSETVTQRRGLFDAVEKTSFLLRTRTRVFRKNRPLDHHVCVKLCGTTVYLVVEYRFIGCFRPPFEHLSTTVKICRIFTSQPNIRIVRHFQTFGKSIAQRLVRVFSNVWQKCFPTFGKSVFQRFKNIFSTFDKGVIQCFIKVLSNV